MPQSILIANNVPFIVRGIEVELLEIPSEFVIKKVINSGKQLWSSIEIYSPDIIIFQINLPNASGLETIREIKERFPYIKILVLSPVADENVAMRAIKAKASAVLSFNISIKTFKEALRVISRGGIFLCDLLRKKVSEEF